MMAYNKFIILDIIEIVNGVQQVKQGMKLSPPFIRMLKLKLCRAPTKVLNNTFQFQKNFGICRIVRFIYSTSNNPYPISIQEFCESRCKKSTNYLLLIVLSLYTFKSKILVFYAFENEIHIKYFQMIGKSIF